jgi:hypothetical protein
MRKHKVSTLCQQSHTQDCPCFAWLVHAMLCMVPCCCAVLEPICAQHQVLNVIPCKALTALCHTAPKTFLCYNLQAL